MNWPTSLFVATLAAVLGAIAAGVVSTAWLDAAYSRPDVGGALLVAIAVVVGGAVCFFAGLATARSMAAGPEQNLARALWWTCGPLAAILALAFLVIWIRADTAPTIDGRQLELLVELRVPEGYPRRADHRYTLSVGNDAKVVSWRGYDIARATAHEGGWTVTATVPLQTRAENKRLFADVGTSLNAVFALPLRGRPTREDMQWSAWLEAEPMTGDSQPLPPGKILARYRVVLADDPQGPPRKVP